MISRRRWFILAAVVLALIGLPYLIGILANGKDYVFNGFLLNAGDSSSYLAKMYEGWNGSWRFTLPYTADPGQGGYIFLFYLFLGHLAHWLGVPLLVIFHAARLIGAMLMLAALARFMNVFVGARNGGAWNALVWAAVGGGLGWLVLGFGLQPADTWVVDGFPFLSAFSIPHFALALAVMFWLFSRAYAAPGPSTWRGAVIEFLAALLLGVISPFSVVVTLVVLGGDALWTWRLLGRAYWQGKTWLRLAWIFLGGAPMLLYQFWLTQVDPILGVWNAQNMTPSPAPWDVLVSFSPALILAVAGGWVITRRSFRNPPVDLTTGRSQPARLLVVWAVLGLVLLYTPFALQRRFILGLYVPLVGLAVLGLGEMQRYGNRLRALAIGLSLPTTLIVLTLMVFNSLAHNPILYMTRSEADAMAWIRAHTAANALILAAPDTGTLIPANTSRQVIYGHLYETINAAQEKKIVEDYFSGRMDTNQAASLLVERRVDLVFCGPREQQLAATLAQPDNQTNPLTPSALPVSDASSPGCPVAAGLPIVFQEGNVILYAAGQ